ncbi:MAG: heavy metal transporter [Candidatus Marinimicrobia bacterium]|nr:heavy metal transporter [Candidatus Neomarinimicrobiota bacterium]|tara:strand:+ start:7952 stop:8662 length:711 start_codon:yes stop_codon:yes gene_type:complete
MENTYHIDGMTCSGCVETVEKSLRDFEGIDDVKVSLEKNKVSIKSNRNITINELQNLLPQKYTVNEYFEKKKHIKNKEKTKIKELWPLILSFIYVLISTILINYGSLAPKKMMSDFMGLFFIFFSFFKLLDIRGFSHSFSMYDMLAKRISFYGLIYPFIEIILGIMFLFQLYIFYALLITIVILLSTIIGVIQTLLSKESIRCACLGTVLNLPMTEATLIENSIMLIMATTTFFML